MKYPDDFINKIIQGDCLEIMKEIPDNSIDTIITDPPYALGFMGKAWDKFPTDRGARKPFANQSKESKLGGHPYQEWTRQWAKEALRVAKPGATLLCFGGTRTWHRMACGLEDAGWIIKDTLMWLYGSGFPKSLNIGKAVDKLQGNERKVIGKKITPSGQKYPEGYEKNSELFTRASADLTIGNSEWEGWGTALKPAWEPIIMAMKPNEGSYAENALKWGVAGLNIDGGRIGIEKIQAHHAPKGTFAGGEPDRGSDTNYYTNQGRFPANLLLDEEAAEMLDEQAPQTGALAPVKSGQKGFGGIIYGKYKQAGDDGKTFYGDKLSGASRFFYVAKASKSERDMGLDEFEPQKVNDGRQTPIDNPFQRGETPRHNIHPTVKPLKLMEYLCILTKTPTGGIILDPFAGSGTTCMAAKKVGRDFIGIEKEPEYVKIAEARLNAIQKPLL